MNKKQRAQIDVISEKLDELKEEVEAIREVEQEKLDNLEERFGGTKKVRQIEEQIDLLEQVVGSIEEALNSLGGIG